MNDGHLGGSGVNGDPITKMPDVWGYVCLKYRLRSILDVGCAMGYNAKWLLDRGYDVEGVEGLPYYVRENLLPKDRIHQHDYATGPYVPKRAFNLALCTEFVEHVEERFVPNFLATFTRCQFVLLTHALPGQGGHHHVNEQDPSYWKAWMTSIGFDHVRDEDDVLRSTFQVRERYGRNTLTLFRRG